MTQITLIITIIKSALIIKAAYTQKSRKEKLLKILKIKIELTHKNNKLILYSNYFFKSLTK